LREPARIARDIREGYVGTEAAQPACGAPLEPPGKAA